MNKPTHQQAQDWIKTHNAKVYVLNPDKQSPAHHEGCNHKIRIAVVNPYWEGHFVVGCANSFEDCVDQCIKGLHYMERNKSEYVIGEQ